MIVIPSTTAKEWVGIISSSTPSPPQTCSNKIIIARTSTTTRTTTTNLQRGDQFKKTGSRYLKKTQQNIVVKSTLQQFRHTKVQEYNAGGREAKIPP